MNLNNNVSNTNIVGAVKLANAAGGFTTGVKPDNKKVEPSNPFVIVGYILFASSIIVSIGIFLYSRYLDKRAISNLNEINKYSNEMKGVPLSDIHQLLSKLSAFSEVANKHAYLPAAFRFLETITIRNVFWKSFDYLNITY